MRVHLTCSMVSRDEPVVVLLVLYVAACGYLLPLVVAASTRHRHAVAIIMLNVFLGCTIVGRLISFVRALVNSVNRPQSTLAHSPPRPDPTF